jgi:hypothetical protein
VAERAGFDLLPEFGYRPVNKYLPPRARRQLEPTAPNAAVTGTDATAQPGAGSASHEPASQTGAAERLFAWIDQMLSR